MSKNEKESCYVSNSMLPRQSDEMKITLYATAKWFFIRKNHFEHLSTPEFLKVLWDILVGRVEVFFLFKTIPKLTPQ